MFSITAFNLSIELAAQTKEDYDSWMRAFKRLQDDFNAKRERLLSNF